MVRPLGSTTKPPEPMPERCADCGWNEWFESNGINKSRLTQQCAVFTSAQNAWMKDGVCQAKQDAAGAERITGKCLDYAGKKVEVKKSHKKKKAFNSYVSEMEAEPKKVFFDKQLARYQ